MDEMTDQERYAKIVTAVKAEFAAGGKKHAGDDVTYEILKRWSKTKGEKFTPPRLKVIAEPVAAGEAPRPPGFADNGAGHKPQEGLRIKIPEKA